MFNEAMTDCKSNEPLSGIYFRRNSTFPSAMDRAATKSGHVLTRIQTRVKVMFLSLLDRYNSVRGRAL